jgi:predicted NAD/FAD-dependent oxidoreductase
MAAAMCAKTLAQIARGDVGNASSLRNARITLCTSRGKLATQMGPKNQTVPQDGKPFFDYGCQYFTATDQWFQEQVGRWEKTGLVTALAGDQVGTLSAGSGFKPVRGGRCWVGNGGMGPMLAKVIEDIKQEFSGIVEHIAGFPDSNMAVKSLSKKSNAWELGTLGGKKLGPFDFVIGGFAQHVLTDPFLLTGGQACQKMLQCLRRLESNQLIPIQVCFEGGPLPSTFTAAHVYGEDCLSFVCNNSRKPQQSGKDGTPGPQHWTLLSTAKFAETEFNTNPKGYKRSAQEGMLGALSRLLGITDLTKHRPVINRINHWEDGLATNTPPNSKGCLFDVEAGLGWCGDFCVFPGIQGAALSGRAMATTLSSYIEAQSGFDDSGMLPFDDLWLPFQSTERSILLDIGAFSSELGLAENWTHTDLVPSAIDGYKPETHTGAAGAKISNDTGSGKGSKGKGSSKGKQGYKGAGGSKSKGKSSGKTGYY